MSEASQSHDLRNRIFFTLFILSVYRFGTFVPIPGIDPEQLQIMMQGNQKGLLGMFNVFAGGAVSRMAIFALGIMPYISSSIIVQLLTGVSDYFKKFKKPRRNRKTKDNSNNKIWNSFISYSPRLRLISRFRILGKFSNKPWYVF